MPRTTLDIDKPILADLKKLQKREGKSLGRLVSELLAQALASRKSASRERPRFEWVAHPMKARMDLTDREAVYAALDREDPVTRGSHRR